MKTEKTRQLPSSESGELPEWMMPPTLASIFQPTPRKTLLALRATQKDFEELAATGEASARVQATIALVAYRRTCALLEELEERRLEVIAERPPMTKHLKSTV